MKQLKVVFRGRVQGVGFRFTTERIARKFKVTGYVKNLPDDSVEMIAEGEEREVQSFFASIQDSHLKHNIEEQQKEWSDASGSWLQFSIKA